MKGQQLKIAICENCKRGFPAARRDARTCGATCRQALSRKLRRPPEPEPVPEEEIELAALYVLDNGQYTTFRHVKPYPKDAHLYDGPWPVVAHPPCGPWGRFRHVAKGNPQDAIDAVRLVEKWGGVLEHPAWSQLWPRCKLPLPSLKLTTVGTEIVAVEYQPRRVTQCESPVGGFTIETEQLYFGHGASKPTWLYIVGLREKQCLPPLPPLQLPTIRQTVESMNRRKREATPPAFATWLLDVARRCNAPS